MKKIFYSFLLLAFVSINFSTSAQVQGPVDLFCEDFDLPPSQWKMENVTFPKPSGTNPGSTALFYRDQLVTRNNSTGSATDTVGNRTSSYLQTPNIGVNDINGVRYLNIDFSFEHICYIDRDEDAVVEYSLDNGVTWTRMPANSHTGSKYDFPGDLKFCKVSRPVAWRVGDNDMHVWPPNTTAWFTENFSMTDILDNNPSVDSFRVRLGLIDDGASLIGRVGTHRWIVENFCVKGSDCETINPTVDLLEPPTNYPERYVGRVYWEGPYKFNAQITDFSTIDTSYVAFEVKRQIAGVWTSVTIDTVPMVKGSGPNYEGIITNPTPGGTQILVNDSVYWKLAAIDNSGCFNETNRPLDGYNKFLVKPTLPEPCKKTTMVYNFPYYQDFNDINDFRPNSSVLGDGWKNPSGDFHEWWVNSGPSSPNGTFRINDDFPGNGQYLYVESDRANGGNYKDSTAYLHTPCFDLTELDNGLVKFYLNMNTSGVEDSLRVDVFNSEPILPDFPNGRFEEAVIPIVRGNKGDNWLPFEFSTYPYKDEVILVRFAAFPGKDNGLSDMAIDSFKLTSAPLIDVRANNINISPFIPAGKDEVITVNIQNLSVTPVDTVTMYYKITGCQPGPNNSCGQTFQEGWRPSVPLSSGESRDFTFSIANSFKAPEGDFVIEAWVKYDTDNRAANDTTFSNAKGLRYSPVKFMDDFDGDTLWTTFVADDPFANQWELGKPNYDYTYSAYTEPNSWDILLNRPYTGTGKTVNLLSPFFDFSNSDGVIFSFINNRDIDTTKDGVIIEYSMDRGLTWDSVPGFQDPGRWKWYNSNLSADGRGGDPAFSGNTFCMGKTWNGYLESEVILPDTFNFEPEVLLRFSFFAENDNDGNDGMSIDNILLYDPTPWDVQTQHYLSPTSQCNLQPNQKISTIFKNRGLNTVNTFSIEYRVKHLPTGQEEVKTDVINRTINHRDTIHVTSASTFDMTQLGDYEVKVITKLTDDGCLENDTITKLVENIDGCSLKFVIETSHRPNVQLPCDSSVWRFTYTSGDRNYEVSEAYNWNQNPINLPAGISNDTIDDLFVCIKSNSEVQFSLNDIDTLVEKFSFIAFNGQTDTILYDGIQGGPDAPTLFFDWKCPPKRSTSPQRILVNNDRVELPVAQDYAFDVVVLNNGTDSIVSYNLHLQVDNRPVVSRPVSYPLPTQLKYNRRRTEGMGSQFLTPGLHVLKTWTTLPNGQADLLPEDDTLYRNFVVMDTVKVMDSIYRPMYCDDFEGSGPLWIGLDPYNLDQRSGSFEQGTPTKQFINSASSGSSAWVTNLDDNYRNLDSTSVISPFVYLRKDSCYKISFMHKYHITDSINDGGTLQMLDSDYANYSEKAWLQIGSSFGDTTIIINDTLRNMEGQKNWFNRRHILAIPDNNKNSGWSGISNGWVKSENLIRVNEDYFTAFRWRFEADGSVEGDGWAIDDFCFESISKSFCSPVGINEALFKESDLYLGQNIPNPATNSTKIPYHIPSSGMVQFTIVNMLGQTMYEETMNRPKGDGLIDLNLSDLSKGIYFYTMSFEGKSVTQKMIVAR